MPSDESMFTPTGLDAPPPGFGRPPRRLGRRRRGRHRGRAVWVLEGVVLLLVFAVAGPLVFFHLIEGNAPSRLSLPAAAGVGKGPVLAGPVSGTWTVSSGSQAGFRVQEILFGQHHTAVGRTSKVSGGLVISGTTVTAADFTVDLASVTTDRAGRNVQFHGYVMETYKYPHGTFHLTRPIRLGAIPPSGRRVTEDATGQLTLRGVTRTVHFPLHAERVAGAIDVNAEIPITFSSWHIPNPSFAVAQVGPTGLVEVLLHLVTATP